MGSTGSQGLNLRKMKGGVTGKLHGTEWGRLLVYEHGKQKLVYVLSSK